MEIRNQLVDRLMKAGAFWSYDRASVRHSIHAENQEGMVGNDGHTRRLLLLFESVLCLVLFQHPVP